MTIRCLLLTALLLAWPVVCRADMVTDWTRLADQLGHGGANWRTLAIMHQAMHDAWNAADPQYERWYAPAPGEPSGTGADPRAALMAAARRVLAWEHPDAETAADVLLLQQYRRLHDTQATRAGLVLGDAIADAAVARRRNDGFYQRHQFAAATGAGRWQKTPEEFTSSGTTATRPFLFSRSDDVALPPPPAPGSAAFARELDETMRLGGHDSAERTGAETDAAFFWAYQSSQRGMMILAADLLDAHRRPGGLAEHARFMSRMAAAMADSAILVWTNKEKWDRWRPVTAIRAMIPSQSHWLPLIDTPPHPEYPSGHAADCFTGAALIAGEFPDLHGPILYIPQTGRPGKDDIGMGQHAQGLDPGTASSRQFPDIGAAAEECSNSRIWAGAHFRSADEASRWIAGAIARQSQLFARNRR